jgi:hypothetical protein
MDVLYEVTNLGLAFGTSLTRTGIYRATESFVRAALTHPGLRPRFAALESYIGELQLVRFDEWAGGLLGARRVNEIADRLDIQDYRIDPRNCDRSRRLTHSISG